MTEKRFTYLNASKNHYIGSFFCNSVPLTNKEVVDLLNENEQLKETNQKLYDKLQETMSSLKMGEIELIKKENEQLKQTIDCICKDYETFHGRDIRNAEWFTAW